MMHPKIVFPGELAPIFDDLARPMYEECIRDHARTAQADEEVSLANGYTLDAVDFADEPHLDVLLDDMNHFMSTAMDVRESQAGYAIRCRLAPLQSRPADAVEAHSITVGADQCEVIAEDLDGLRRALYRLQDEMRIRRAPLLPLGSEERWTHLKTRIIRSPVAPYRWLSGWELEDENDYYPEEYLRRLAHSGINGLWVPALVRNMVASKTIPELGPTTHRLDKLNHLIEKAARHGIRIYLFCIEPRALSDGHPAGVAHPEILGARGALCTSVPMVREYVREVMQTLFTQAPKLAGMINIFCGERASSCCSLHQFIQECPRCRQRPRDEVLAETLNDCMDGIRAASPTAEFMAWTYMMDSHRETSPIGPMLDVMTKSRDDVVWLGNFEHGSTKNFFGKEVEVHEYSLSCVGPSDYFRQMAKATLASNRQVYAKLQVGTSYEMSSVPHIPVPGIVRDKITAALEAGATGAMLGWIPGGFPSPLLTMVGEAAFAQGQSHDQLTQRVAAIDWGEQRCKAIASAWEVFAKAWQCYPFDNAVLYWGPVTRGVSYQLHLEQETRLAKPYNWGFNRKRETQPFEDKVERWLGVYTVDEICHAFREMARMWQDGLDLFDSVVTPNNESFEVLRQIAVAKAVRLQCMAAANIYEFYSLRDMLKQTDESKHSGILRRMHQIALDDRDTASQMLEVMEVDPMIGFESEIFDYSFSKSLVEEKILQVTDLLPVLERWEQEGVDTEVLSRTIEEAEWLRPDRVPDRWGD